MWLIIGPSFSSLYPIPALRSTCVKGISAITNNNGEKESPWKMPLLMFTEPRHYILEYSLVLHLVILLDIRSITLSATPNICNVVIIQECGTMSYAFLWSIQAILRFVLLRLQFFSTHLSMERWSFVPWHPFLKHFCSSGRRLFCSKWEYVFSLIIAVNSFHKRFRHAIGL